MIFIAQQSNSIGKKHVTVVPERIYYCTPIKLLFPLFFMQQAIQDDNAGGTTSTGDLGITLKSSKLFFHHLTNLRPTMTPIKELKGPVGQLKVIFSCSATPNSKCRNK